MTREIRPVLIVFPRSEDLSSLLRALAVAGQIPLICHTFEEAQELLKHEPIQTIICEDHFPHAAVEGILKLAKHRRKPIPMIIASRTGGWEEFLKVLRQGVFDYLVLPPRQEEVRRVLELAAAESREVARYGSEFEGSPPLSTEEFVLGLGEGRIEYATPSNAHTCVTHARVPSND
jgi:DNA-binding NtrC family response regulator